MRQRDGQLLLAPTDLSNFLGCRHLSVLDRLAAKGETARPSRFGPFIEELRARGLAHEQAYLSHLRGQGLSVAAKENSDPRTPAGRLGIDETLAAMHSGVDVIYQASLSDNTWSGIADFLRKVTRPSSMGDWSYEPTDTKLSRETRAGTILQLCVYSCLLKNLQGVRPEHMWVVTPGNDYEPLLYRTDDYGAYFRLLERRFKGFVQTPPETYPELVSLCEVCAWWEQCERRRRADDHLCYVAGIHATQIQALRELGVHRLAELAQLAEVAEPSRGSKEALLRVRDQARVQWLGRERNAPLHELREPLDAEHGLALLPEPSPDDIFLDFEGNHFADGGVEEYLTGYLQPNREGSCYTALWARTHEEERRAFERFIDVATTMRAQNPRAHIYHFAPYEPAALKRLMGRYATRETELDALLRGGAFVDLYTVVRRSLVASVERYSIKDLEPFFGFERQQELYEAALSRRLVEHAIEANDWDEGLERHRRIVEDYNREDCESALRLRDWLERLRSEVPGAGHDLPRPQPADGDPSEKVSDLDRTLRALRDGLLTGVPQEREERSDEEQARFVTAHLMEFHRREDKASWWEYFRLRDLDPEDYPDERRALSGLRFVSVVQAGRAPIQRYSFPPQELDARRQDEVHASDEIRIGKVFDINYAAHTLDIKKTMAAADAHPTAVILYSRVDQKPLRESLMRFGESILATGFADRAPYRTAQALLVRRPPPTAGKGVGLQRRDESTVDAACRIALKLDGDVLAIQGPPGTGKTYTGAKIICALKARGLKVGVTANSHKVILKLLEGAKEEARRQGMRLEAVHRGRESYDGEWGIRTESSYDAILAGLAGGGIDVVGATAFAWSRAEFAGSVDVLIVDEAGQMALGNVLAAAPAGNGLILLGDPQQLEQPLQSSHPDGSEVSALYHWLEGEDTMPPDRGLFLAETYRLHPDIVQFTSDVYYERKVRARPELANQAILAKDGAALPFTGSGLRYLPVAHNGNQAKSPEEVAAIARLVEDLLVGANWRDKDREIRPLAAQDILIVAPYNAQVAALVEALPALSGRIGTVDRFQGQEAPLVIYSMTSSSATDAPHGMEFLYNGHRFNVATSRARALCILVGNPPLFEPECRTPRQMRMANGFCRYLELSETQAGRA